MDDITEEEILEFREEQEDGIMSKRKVETLIDGLCKDQVRMFKARESTRELNRWEILRGGIHIGFHAGFAMRHLNMFTEMWDEILVSLRDNYHGICAMVGSEFHVAFRFKLHEYVDKYPKMLLLEALDKIDEIYCAYEDSKRDDEVDNA